MCIRDSARALHAATVIGEGDGAVGDHIAHLGHGLALKTAGHGARRIDAAVTDLTDVPELLTLGAMPQYEARWSWSGNLPMSTDTAVSVNIIFTTITYFSL